MQPAVVRPVKAMCGGTPWQQRQPAAAAGSHAVGRPLGPHTWLQELFEVGRGHGADEEGSGPPPAWGSLPSDVVRRCAGFLADRHRCVKLCRAVAGLRSHLPPPPPLCRGSAPLVRR